jgi:hypothetical protein
MEHFRFFLPLPPPSPKDPTIEVTESPIGPSSTPENELFSIDESRPEQFMSHLVLRRIIKENHNSGIHQILFNHIDMENKNLVATIANVQVGHLLSPIFFSYFEYLFDFFVFPNKFLGQHL